MAWTKTRRSILAAFAAAGFERSGAARAAVTPATASFRELSQRALDASFRSSPYLASFAGEHRYDAELDDYSREGRRARLISNRTLLADLARIDRSQLSRADQVDAAILDNVLRSAIFDELKLQSWAWDAAQQVNVAGQSLCFLVARAYAPLPQRLLSAAQRMSALGGYFRRCRSALQPARVPIANAQTAIAQIVGIVRLIDDGILSAGAGLDVVALTSLMEAAARGKAAIFEHRDWLETTVLPQARGDFRIGAALFDEKLELELNATLSRAEIKRRAFAQLARVHDEMYALARKVLVARPGAPAPPKNPSRTNRRAVIRGALELACEARPAREGVVDEARKALAEATAFVRGRDFLTLPSAPVELVVMPEFKRGYIPFNCEQPGALETSLPTLFAVSPIPGDWTDKQADSFLREYSDRGIREITIHEAMPGHYVQLGYSNRYPSILRGVFPSGTFIEGWAVYGQDLMADGGFLDRDPLYRLVHLKLQLRTIANAILDQGVHAEGMSREDALRLLTEDAFQEEAEAEGKWTRVQLSAVQLSTYFIGWQEHWAIRREVERRQGAAFNLKNYHDRVLSFGSPPPRYVRQLVLDEAIV